MTQKIVKKYIARDVNNYCAQIEDGELYTKGVFKEPGIDKNPAGHIIYKAVADYFINKTAIPTTMYNEDEIKNFIFTRQIRGGGRWKTVDIGKNCKMDMGKKWSSNKI